MSADDFVRSEVLCHDGVKLAAFLWEPDDATEDTPTVFLVNGLGGNLTTWRHQLRALRARGYRIATWDYRGLYRSALSPEQARRVGLDVGAHAGDAVAVLDALGIERAVFVGWSMGVQLNFELYRRIPERFEAIIQVAGSYGRALETTRFGKLGARVIPYLAEGWRHAAARLAPTITRLARTAALMKIARSTGLVAETFDEELVRELIDDYMKLDFAVYNRILMSLNDHDAWDSLRDITVPVLVLAGTRDPMTPHWLSRKMVDAIPGAELKLVEGGSHYVPVEYPEQVNDAFIDFLERRVGHGAKAEPGD